MLETQDIWTCHPVSSALWPVTVELLRSAWLVPKPEVSYELMSALGADDGTAPWSASLSVAFLETAAAIERALRRVMLATPDLDPDRIDLSRIEPDSRAFRHLSSLITLWRQLGGALPDDLHVIRHVLAAPPGDAVIAVPVMAGNRVRRPPLIEALIARLAAEHGTVGTADAARLADERGAIVPGAAAGSLLAAIQAGLTGRGSHRLPRDGTLRAYTVRDLPLAADLAASQVQSMLDADPSLAMADFAILIANDDTSLRTAAESFCRAGLPLAGLPGPVDRLSPARDLLSNFLEARRPESPRMARASVLASPLMPWSRAEGLQLAGRLMGDGWLRTDNDLINCILARGSSEAVSLARDLGRLRGALTSDQAFTEDVKEAKGLIGVLLEAIRSPGEARVDWQRLAALVTPGRIAATEGSTKTTDGVRVFIDGIEPWASCRHLFVIGFSEGHFPPAPGHDPFFLDAEIEAIAETTGLRLEARADVMADRLVLFARQLATARDCLTLIVPVRRADGAPAAPASTLALIARFVEGCEEPDKLPLALNAIAEDNWPEEVPRALETKSLPATLALPAGPRLSFGRNLFEIRRKEDGSVASQSPSRLEKLAVSPLAWLLGELGATDEPWAPDALDVRIKGNIAHKLIELLFPPGVLLPDRASLEAAFPDAFERALAREAPFLAADHWMVERRALATTLRRAAHEWRDRLAGYGASVLGAEFRLTGTLFGIAVTGKADCLIRLEGGELVIVDHKTSGSGGRWKRLEAGFDLQVELYRQMAMYAAHRPAESQSEDGQLFVGANRIGIAYHTLNDRQFLVGGLGPGLADARVFEPANSSREAIPALAAEISAAKKGEIRLNRASEPADLSKRAGIGAYLFDVSPLVSAFMLTEGDENDGEDGNG